MIITGKVKTTAAGTGPLEDVSAELANRRDLAAERRRDELARFAAEAEHARNRADVAEAAERAERDRAERVASGRADSKLARMYREARASGERTRVSAHMARSGEARALRLERLRILNLRVLVPVLLGFAAWSTTGVQQGAARLMLITDADLTWWALWILEPVLIGAVVWVIVSRARLAASGGRLAEQAVGIAAGCLMTSILLNLASATWPSAWTLSTVSALLASILAHAIGPVGAAATAHLIGIIDESISAADPWHDEHGEKMPLLAELHLGTPSLSLPDVPELAGVEPLAVRPRTEWPVPLAGRTPLPIIARPVGPMAEPSETPAADSSRSETRTGNPGQDLSQPDQASDLAQDHVVDLPSAIRSARASGLSYKQIATAFNITKYQVEKIVKAPPGSAPDLVSATVSEG